MAIHFDHDERFRSTDYDAVYVEGQRARYEAGVYEARERWLNAYLPRPIPDDVLDAACGIGWFTAKLAGAKRHPIAIDFALEPLRAAKARTLRGRFVRGSLEDLPLRAGAFDLVLACDVLEHVYEPERLLAELARVTRPGARLILLTDNASSPSRWKGLKRFAERLRRRSKIAARLEAIRKEVAARSLHVALYSAREVERMLAAHGFEVERLDTFPRIAPRWLERLLASRFSRTLAKRHRGGALIVSARRT